MVVDGGHSSSGGGLVYHVIVDDTRNMDHLYNLCQLQLFGQHLGSSRRSSRCTRSTRSMFLSVDMVIILLISRNSIAVAIRVVVVIDMSLYSMTEEKYYHGTDALPFQLDVVIGDSG